MHAGLGWCRARPLSVEPNQKVASQKKFIEALNTLDSTEYAHQDVIEAVEGAEHRQFAAAGSQ